ncbi:TPA: helix-turn-helix domain-containing protein, partial [Providencia stuartii]
MSSFTPPIELIAKALVRERQKSGLSLSELSRQAGIAKSTLSQLEAGNGNP